MKYVVLIYIIIAVQFLMSCTLNHKIAEFDIDMSNRGEQVYYANLYSDKYDAVGNKQGPYCFFVRDSAIKSQAAMDSINRIINNTNMVYGISTYLVVLSDTTIQGTEAIFRSNYSDAGFVLSCFSINKKTTNWNADVKIWINDFTPEIASELKNSKLEIRLGKHSWK